MPPNEPASFTDEDRARVENEKLREALEALIEGVDRIDSTLDRNHGFCDLIVLARAALEGEDE